MLFAALELATGKVVDQCYDRHGKAEFLYFLEKFAKAYPRRRLHAVLDNYHTHKHADVEAWLAKHPRITLHFTPTSGCRLNMVEIFFGIITRQAIRDQDRRGDPAPRQPQTNCKGSALAWAGGVLVGVVQTCGDAAGPSTGGART